MSAPMMEVSEYVLPLINTEIHRRESGQGCAALLPPAGLRREMIGFGTNGDARIVFLFVVPASAGIRGGDPACAGPRLLFLIALRRGIVSLDELFQLK